MKINLINFGGITMEKIRITAEIEMDVDREKLINSTGIIEVISDGGILITKGLMNIEHIETGEVIGNNIDISEQLMEAFKKKA